MSRGKVMFAPLKKGSKNCKRSMCLFEASEMSRQSVTKSKQQLFLGVFLCGNPQTLFVVVVKGGLGDTGTVVATIILCIFSDWQALPTHWILKYECVFCCVKKFKYFWGAFPDNWACWAVERIEREQKELKVLREAKQHLYSVIPPLLQNDCALLTK